MDVIFSNEVKIALELYRQSLSNYPISIERAIEKFDNMVNALNGLGESISTPAICNKKDLGQILSINGTPINRNLRRFNYKDESQFQWSFACHYDYDNDTITIVKMMASNQIKEEIEKNNFSARATHSCIKLARTIADMQESFSIRLEDLTEAVSYRKNEGGINYCF